MSSNIEKLEIDDLLVLGNAVPDFISDNRISVCTAGFSKKHGLVRVYPVRPDSPMNRWNIVSVQLERNPKDTRHESWKVQGSRSDWANLNSKIKVIGKVEDRKEKLSILEEINQHFGVGCIEQLNSAKASLGIILPEILSYEIATREDYEPYIQSTLDKKVPFLTIKNYPAQPRIVYRCEDCKTKKPHDQQLIEWGAYQYLRLNAKEKWGDLWKALHIGEENYYTSFLVGNQKLHRRSFMIISVFRMKV